MSVSDRDTGASVPQNLQVAHFQHMLLSSLKCSDFFFLKYFYSCKCSFGSFHDSIKLSHFFQGFYLFYNVCLFNFVLLSCLFVFQAELLLI